MEAHGLQPTPRNNRCRGQPLARQLVRYLRKRDKLNQGLVWSSDLSLWGNQPQKNYYEFWTEPRPCMVLGLKPMGKPTTKNYYEFWTEPRPCMVLGLKPMGKPTKKKKLIKKLNYYKFWTEPKPCMVLGPKLMGKPTT